MTPWGIEFIRRNAPTEVINVLEIGSRIVLKQTHPIKIRNAFPGVLQYIGTDVELGENVDCVVSAYDLVSEFGRESFDCVVSGDALEHIEDWKLALHQMWAVLKKDGRLIVTTVDQGKARHDYPNDYHRFSLGDFDRIFRKQEIHALGRRGYFVGAAVIKRRGDLSLEGVEVFKVPDRVDPVASPKVV